jgi:diacylglycerol kinase family enzyme
MSPVVVSHRPVALLVNPNAAGGRTLRLLPRVEERLGDLGVGVRSHVTRSLEHAADLAQAPAAEGLACVSFGGDDVIARGPARPVDVGEAGTRTFLTIASLGVDSEVNRLAAAARGPRGRLVYLLAALRATATWRTAAFAVTLDDGRAVRMRGWTVAAANGSSYGAGMRLAPAARVDDGTLDVVLIARLSRAGLLLALPSVFAGAHVRVRAVPATLEVLLP